MVTGIGIGSKFYDQKGEIQTLIFADAYNYVLEKDEDKSQKTMLSSQDFENYLDEQKYIHKLEEKPHVPLTEYQKADRDDRLKYILTLRDLVTSQGLAATTLNTYKELIKEVEKRHPETLIKKHPAQTTIARYWRTWVISGFDPDSLASKRRFAASRLNAKTEAEIQAHVSTVWSASDSKIKRAHYAAYKCAVEEKAKIDSEIKLASERTFYRRLGSLKEVGDKLNNPRLSSASKNQLLLTLRRSIRTYFAMQRVELDRLHVNMCLIDDETLKPTKTISLYTAIDCMTRYPIAVVVDYGKAENKENVLNLLRQCYFSDENLIAKGKPFTLVMDNGAGFNNAAIWKACQRLGISPVYTPSNQPVKKPFVESFNKTLRQSFFKGMILEDDKGLKTVGFNSYKGKRTDINNEKLEKKMEKYADVKVSDFLRLLNIFLTEYTHKFHEEAKLVPVVAWNESIKRTPRPHTPYNQMLQAFHVLKDKQSNKLQARGSVHILGENFFSDELKTLYQEMVTYSDNGENPDVEVFFDPFDARYVTVSFIDPLTNQAREILAANANLDSMPCPISFDELKGFKPKSYDIFQGKKHTPTGYYQGNVESFYPQKTREKTSGPKAPSFEENISQGLTVSERINNSNNSNPSDSKAFYANLDITEHQEESGSKIPKDSVVKTPSGKARRW
ncbi:transposase family protein [Thalassotalea ponticola]|uniref:integrase catalytic domain-containing protein n=1 Tax=Thalassotalea ponticola TaxID=1523392 RepID=UPI0025B5CBB2|nr:transposase family protein [Thalassotalea ponticola]MDN3653600.1 transposase family protein [Thalassotalea ponticola]